MPRRIGPAPSRRPRRLPDHRGGFDRAAGRVEYERRSAARHGLRAAALALMTPEDRAAKPWADTTPAVRGRLSPDHDNAAYHAALRGGC